LCFFFFFFFFFFFAITVTSIEFDGAIKYIDERIEQMRVRYKHDTNYFMHI